MKFTKKQIDYIRKHSQEDAAAYCGCSRRQIRNFIYAERELAESSAFPVNIVFDDPEDAEMVEDQEGEIQDLRDQLKVAEERLRNVLSDKKSPPVIKTSRQNTIRFGIFSDTHFGSIHSCPENLRAFFEMAERAGCEAMLCAGDILDGHKIWKGQEFEQDGRGISEQLEIAGRICSKIPTYFITGNHDLSYSALTGVDMGALIESSIKNSVCLGDEYANITLTTAEGTPYTVGLHHPGGGSAYSLSYRMQKTIEAMDGGTKPNMLIQGHFHKAEMIPSYRNVCGIQAGTFSWQTSFMQRKGLAAHVGGWIVEVCPTDHYNRVKAEFISFYK
jgi:DNA polymerase II small subunit/DNA polymerase delta subunit B